MTIGAFILEPQNDVEKYFYIPVATESFFKEFWIPAIESLGLQWTDLFVVGVEVEEEDVSTIVEELMQIKRWAEINLVDKEAREKMLERIQGIQEKLPQAFQRKDAVVFIG
ncbi:hypothetical protein AN964_21090 [Heyndrickxia shackletonii]|uniref:Uncharacterized protein n=1 Tax=Heyndrickxia shackletonii TaxID=157838 RepID=A0A0Q3WTK1_9BACI|nr:hypothetical protein [Heyndrickxia shackletonii]KQL51461.1 hypothetical protein AN964_21090 [Heyndrickxia shackletonii]NEZ00810.1 hypothetical protein [Heyndrickxia shackletonii]